MAYHLLITTWTPVSSKKKYDPDIITNLSTCIVPFTTKASADEAYEAFRYQSTPDGIHREVSKVYKESWRVK